MSIVPKNRKHPLVVAMQEATVRLAASHVAVEPEFPTATDAQRTGMVAATWVGSVLVVSASGECADDLASLLHASMLASPERVA